MNWLFWITYALAALTTWLLIFVVAEETKPTIRPRDHWMYVGLALVWPVVTILILGPVIADWIAPNKPEGA